MARKPNKEVTSAGAAKAASKVMRTKGQTKVAKTAAASALTQRPDNQRRESEGPAVDTVLKSLQKRRAGMEPEKLYRELGHLAASAPNLWETDNIDRDIQMWLGRVAARLEQSGDLDDSVDAIKFKIACGGLGPEALHDTSVQAIYAICTSFRIRRTSSRV